MFGEFLPSSLGGVALTRFFAYILHIGVDKISYGRTDVRTDVRTGAKHNALRNSSNSGGIKIM
jgi:hypothetical protein